MSSNDTDPPRKTLTITARPAATSSQKQDTPSMRSGSRARIHKERLRAQEGTKGDAPAHGGPQREPRGDRREGGFAPRGRDDRAGGERREGNFAPRNRDDRFGSDRPQREPRGDRREGGFAPRDRDNRFGGERREGNFAPRNRDDRFGNDRPQREPRGDRREGGFAPRDRDNRFGGERREGNFAPRNRDDRFGSDRPQREPRGDRREGGFAPRGRDDRAGGERREGNFTPRNRDDRFGNDRPQREPRGDRREDGFAPRGRDDRAGGERREGNFAPRSRDDRFGNDRPQREPRGDRREGGFAPRDRDNRFSGERREGNFAPRNRDDRFGNDRPQREPRGDRREGGFAQRDRDNRFSGERREGNFAPRNRDDRFGGNRPQPSSIGAGASQRDSSTFQVFASCPQGLEAALEAELQALDFNSVRQGRAGCHFEADWRGVMRANLYSRLATRVLIQLAQGPVQTEDDILALAAATEWENWFGPEHKLRVDTSAIRSPMTSLQYCNLRVKDGICDRLRDREGARPDIDTVRPDARVHLFLSETTATLYLDTSGESLFKRGWRFDKGAAPLRENLAAGLLALSGWDPAAALLDPFCGSGTILIEAAWIALGVPPGMSRPFGFERLRDYDPYQLGQLRQEAQASILPGLEAPLVGVDLDPAVIAAARSNAERARLGPDTLRFEVGDARHFAPPAETGWIVTNPPYGERLDEHEAELWPEWASQLKRLYAGWHLNVISNDMALPQAMRLKASRRQPVFNGALECRLFSFDLVAGSNRD